jgi:hypothetical protein
MKKPTRKRAARLLALCAAALLASGAGTALAAEKTQVQISDVTVASKTYDGSPAVASEPSAVDTSSNPVTIDSGDFVYSYTSTDGAGYSSATAPTNAGQYQLIVSVSSANASYEGASDPIYFEIARATLTIFPEGGITRYAGLNNPSFPYTYSGAVSGETPAFAADGALSGAATTASVEGVYAIALGSLSLIDNDAFLANNYELTVAADASYRVVSYPVSAVATLATTNLENGVYTGDVTLNAPAGYTIALAPDAVSWGDSVTKTDCSNGMNAIYYYLRVSGGTYGGAMSERKLISAEYDATSPVVLLYSPAADATGIAASTNQKIILRTNEQADAVSGKIVTVTDKTTNVSYTAAATAGTASGNAGHGPWYFVYDLSSFSPELTLSEGTVYEVVVEAGAFADNAGNASSALTASFTTIASGALSDPVSVVFTTAIDGQTVTANGVAVASGQAVQNGAAMQFTTPAADGYTVSETVKVEERQ